MYRSHRSRPLAREESPCLRRYGASQAVLLLGMIVRLYGRVLRRRLLLHAGARRVHMCGRWSGSSGGGGGGEGGRGGGCVHEAQHGEQAGDGAQGATARPGALDIGGHGLGGGVAVWKGGQGKAGRGGTDRQACRICRSQCAEEEAGGHDVCGGMSLDEVAVVAMD